MKTATINLYEFAELSEEAKQKAISDHANFLLSEGQEYENEAGELVTEYPEELEDAYIIESIEANEYMFFHDGEMAHCVTYVGKHPKAGQTELNFHGETITL